MDVKKFTAVLAAMTMAGVISLAQAPVNTPDGLLTVSAATYLRLDSSGDDVKQLQENLIKLNYMQSGSDTGTFDATTDGAVKNFQTEYNLKVDGIVGPATLGLIEGLVDGSAQIVKVNETKVNVRASAGSNGDIITTVDKDQKLKYDSVETIDNVKWYHVSVGETEGYICGTYVSEVALTPANGTAATEAAATNTNTTGGTLKVTGTILNVRSSTSTSSKKLTTVEQGQTFAYSNVKTVDGINWYYIKVNSTTSGWVMGTFVNVTDAAEASGTLRVTGNILNVRASASISAQKITELKNGDTYTYSEVKNVAGINWYYIKVNTTASGWVMGSYVSLVQPGTASAAPESGSLKVTGTVLNVRASTSTSAKKLTTLQQGQSFTYSNAKTVDGTKWYYIRVNDSLSGWVMGDYVYPTPNTAATNSATEEAAATDGGTLKIQGTLVNVRSGAGLENDKITQVKQGQNYTYTEVRDGWYHIKLSATKSGWVMGDYVEATPNTAASIAIVTTTTTGTATTTAAGAESGSLTVKGDLVNVRSGAGTENAKITEVKQGESYTYTDKKDGWYYIRISETQSGWIMGDYVTATPSPTTAASESASVTSSAEETGTLIITDTLVNVRAGVGTDSAKVTEVRKGESYTYTSVRNNWYYIKVNDTTSGWVMGDFVQATPNSTNAGVTVATAPVPESGTLRVKGDVVNVRSGAGTENAKITEVKQNSTYAYSDKQNNWYYIKVSETQSGWISGDYVEATPNTTASTTTTTAVSVSTSTTATSTTNSTGTANANDNANASTQSTETTTTTTTVNHTGTLTITGASVVNVRAGAGTEFSKIGEVKKGNVYTYTNVDEDERGDWYYVQYSASQSGWILGKYAVITPNTGTTKATAAYTAVGTLTVTGTKINIRSMPDKEATVLAEAKKGETFQYLYQMDEWYCIQQSSGQTGWVLASYVTVKPYPTTVTDPNEVTTLAAYGEKSGTFVVTSEKPLNVRLGPGTSYEKIAELESGEKYNYIDIKDNWHCINLYDEQNGWVSGDYVRATPNATAASVPAATESTETTTTTVTTSATTTTAGYLTMVAGESTTVSTEATSSTTDATETTSTTDAAETTETAEPTTTTTAATVGRKVTVGTVKVSSGNLNVRSGAGTKYSKLGTLKNGTVVVIATKGSTWHKIEYGTGYGYVTAEYITDIQTTYENMILKYSTDYNYVDKGQTIDLSLAVGGASVSYTSSDSVRCPVSNNGIVTGKTEGLYTITAKSGAAVTTTCVVVLKEPYTDIQPMKISPEGTQFIANWEGGDKVLPTGEIGFFPYQDVSGYWTIGYGHAKTTTASKSWSEERAIAEFNKDIEAMIGADYMLTDERPYLTPEGATALLHADLNDGPYVQAVNDWAVRNGVKLTQTQFDALVSFCYNLGPSLWQNDNTKFYLKSAIIAHRSGSKANADQVIEGFCRYMKSAGKNYKGLWYRRRNEAELFLEGDYAIDRENKFTLPSGVTWA